MKLGSPSTLCVLMSILAAACLMQASEFSKPMATGLWLASAGLLIARLKLRRPAQDESKGDRFFRELSDAISDPILLMAAGYCNDWVVKIASVPVGWVAAVLAVLSILIRVLGESLGGIRKPGAVDCAERLIILIVACLGSVFELWVCRDVKFAQEVMRVALGLLVIGGTASCVGQIRAIARSLA